MDANRAGTATYVPGLDRTSKHFTVAEANRSLVYTGRIVRDVMSVHEQVLSMRQAMEAEPNEAHAVSSREYEAALERLSELLRELAQLGVELKDYETGLVDFPAWHEGRPIMLCWQVGEPSVEHWHEADAGFAGRQDVAQLTEATRGT